MKAYEEAVDAAFAGGEYASDKYRGKAAAQCTAKQRNALVSANPGCPWRMCHRGRNDGSPPVVATMNAWAIAVSGSACRTRGRASSSASKKRSIRTSKPPKSSAAFSRPKAPPSSLPGSRAAVFRWSATSSAPSSGRGFFFRDTLDAVRHLVELKIDPAAFWKRPVALPRCAAAHCGFCGPSWSGPARSCDCPTTIRELPQLVSWPSDGGTVHHLAAGLHRGRRSPRLAALEPRHVSRAAFRQPIPADRQVGLHYQIHRGIGVHHAAAIAKGVPFRVNIFVGGPPAMALAAVMPLPEGLPELAFAGALGRPAGPRLVAIQSDSAAQSPSRRRFLSSPAPSIPSVRCRKDRSAIISAITAWRIRFRC